MIIKYKRDFFLPPSQVNIWIFLGLALVSVIFWNPFLGLRLPRELEDFHWYWVLLLLLVFLISLGLTLKKIY